MKERKEIQTSVEMIKYTTETFSQRVIACLNKNLLGALFKAVMFDRMLGSHCDSFLNYKNKIIITSKKS